MSAKQYGQALRNHWGIENNLHWQLDISFGEDANRMQAKTEAMNLAMLRKLALMLLKEDESKGSIKTKRTKAALNSVARRWRKCDAYALPPWEVTSAFGS